MNNNNFNVVTIYSDGGCRGNGKNNNIGAYAYLIQYNQGFNANNTVEHAVAFKNTTNNQMELLGVISALNALEYPSIVTVHSDSKYVCDAVNNGWITNWKKNGWLTAKKEPVKNQDLWIQLDELISKHHCKFSWVKGHADDVHNVYCDTLLNKAMDNFIDNKVDIKKDSVVTESNVVNSSSNNDSIVLDRSILKRLIQMRDELNDIINSFNL